MASRNFTTYATLHGPIVRADGDRWIAFAMMNKPVPALEQSWLRTKATSFAAYMQVAGLEANSSNNTILASAEGTIAYLHPQFVPKRSDFFDYRAPVDGSDPATAWQGLTPLDRLPQVVNPATGWVYNSNDAPWRAAGPDSPEQAKYPRYMDQAGANPRGDHAIQLLSQARDLTLDGLERIAFDPRQPMFDVLVPQLIAAFNALPAGDPRRTTLAEPIRLLSGWDGRWSAASVPTTLAMYWGENLWDRAAKPAAAARLTPYEGMSHSLTEAEKLDALGEAAARIRRDWGTLQVPWGRVNRFQRTSSDIAQRFSDAAPYTSVPFTSAKWGSLASFGAQAYPGTRGWYGTNGNSFVAVVEFGPRVRALAVTAGGESGHQGSPHFVDEVQRYTSGNLRPVFFYDDELTGHTGRVYHPGE